MSGPETAVPAQDRPAPHVRRARVGVCAYFFVAGVIIATWSSRIPAVKAQAGLDDGALSIGLLGLAVGALVAMQAAGRLADRFGSSAVVVPAALFSSASLVAPGYAHSLPVLFAALFGVGVGHGLIDVSMNVHAARVERAYRRPIMASFHAAFSVGGFCGAGAGALAAHVGMGAAGTFWTVGLVLLALSVWVRRWLLPGVDTGGREPDSGETRVSSGGQAEAAPAPPPASRPSARVLLLGVVALCSMLAEGSVTDWASVYLHDDTGASGAVAAAGFAVFSAVMAVGRLAGDRLSARFGPVAVVRAGGVLSAAGLGSALVVPVPAAALAGFALMGAGLSCTVPRVFSAATAQDPRRAGRDLGVVAGVGYVGLLSGPVVIGGIAHTAGLSLALTVPAILGLVIAALGGTVRQAG